MNLSVSNIAWNKSESGEAIKLLKKYEINNIEIAPSLLFDDFINVENKEILEVGGLYFKEGFNFVSMQSLLYGAPNCSIFDEEKSDSLFKYLIKDISIANLLGIKNLVFGSPKNRFIKDLNSKAVKKAEVFFDKLCRLAKKHNINISLEANHKDYGCNFITNTIEALKFVRKMNCSNFKLNLDIGAILMNNENLEEVAKKAEGFIGHVHISVPFLGEIITDQIDHFSVSNTLKSLNYNGFVSLEMKANVADSNIKTLDKNLDIFKKHYE